MGTHPIFESDFDCLTEMMTVLPMSFKVPSTSRVSLNDRFTGLMKSRASSDYHRKSSRNTVPVTDRYSQNYPTAKRSEPLYSRRDRAVERYPENERPVQRSRHNVHQRVGQRNFPGRIRKKYNSYWETERARTRLNDFRGARYSKFGRQRPYRPTRQVLRRSNFGHPLDRMQETQRYEKRPARNFRSYKQTNTGRRRNNFRFGNNDRNRNVLDRDLDQYMMKSNRYNKSRLDDDIDQYMSKSKKGLDRSIDEYMKDARKMQKMPQSAAFKGQ